MLFDPVDEGNSIEPERSAPTSSISPRAGSASTCWTASTPPSAPCTPAQLQYRPRRRRKERRDRRCVPLAQSSDAARVRASEVAGELVGEVLDVKVPSFLNPPPL